MNVERTATGAAQPNNCRNGCSGVDSKKNRAVGCTIAQPNRCHCNLPSGICGLFLFLQQGQKGGGGLFGVKPDHTGTEFYIKNNTKHSVIFDTANVNIM